MSNRDGLKSKRNKSKKYSLPNKICPRCKSSLDKCAEYHQLDHKDHRLCKTCKYSNF